MTKWTSGRELTFQSLPSSGSHIYSEMGLLFFGQQLQTPLMIRHASLQIPLCFISSYYLNILPRIPHIS